MIKQVHFDQQQHILTLNRDKFGTGLGIRDNSASGLPIYCYIYNCFIVILHNILLPVRAVCVCVYVRTVFFPLFVLCT